MYKFSSFIEDLYQTIIDRKNSMPKGSYVASLFKEDNDRIIQKVGEEAVEVVIAAKNNDKSRFISEMADLWFHSIILLALRNMKPEDIMLELKSRDKTKVNSQKPDTTGIKTMEIDFKKNYGLVPVIIQDEATNCVLMLGYMNDIALQKTQETGFVCFWSRSRNKFWMKGEESGNKLEVKSIYIDCDKDTLLIKAKLIGEAACHTGEYTCFFEKV